MASVFFVGAEEVDVQELVDVDSVVLLVCDDVVGDAGDAVVIGEGVFWTWLALSSVRWVEEAFLAEVAPSLVIIGCPASVASRTE